MFTEDKVTEIFCMADDFCKFFDAMMSKYTIKEQKKREYHRNGTLSKALLMSSYSPNVYDGATAEFRDICNYWGVENMGFVAAKNDEQKTEETKQKVIALAKAL